MPNNGNTIDYHKNDYQKKTNHYKTKANSMGEKLAYSILDMMHYMQDNVAIEFLKSVNFILYKEYRKKVPSQFSRNL